MGASSIIAIVIGIAGTSVGFVGCIAADCATRARDRAFKREVSQVGKWVAMIEKSNERYADLVVANCNLRADIARLRARVPQHDPRTGRFAKSSAAKG